MKYGSCSGEGTMKDGIKLKKLDENKLAAVRFHLINELWSGKI